MSRSKYQNMVDSGAVAVKGETNSSGWAIYGYEYGIDDYAIVGYVANDTRYNARKYKVMYTTNEARPYFRVYNKGRLYIDEFIRV